MNESSLRYNQRAAVQREHCHALFPITHGRCEQRWRHIFAGIPLCKAHYRRRVLDTGVRVGPIRGLWRRAEASK